MVTAIALEVMTTSHARWREFIEKLEARLHPRENEAGHWVTDCESYTDKPLARQVLEKMGKFDIEASFEFMELWGGYCDCEILYNVDC